MPYSVIEAVELGNFVLAAYELHKTGNPSGLVLPHGYSFVDTVYADDITDGDPRYVIFGFIATSATDIVVALRGTQGIAEWVWDFDFPFEPFRFGNAGQVVRGFAHFYETLRTGSTDAAPRVIEALNGMGALSTVRIAGHSLGSAVATMLALEAAEKLTHDEVRAYTFGSPLVGDASFVHAYNASVHNSWRLANDHDIVTDVPPGWAGYVHVNTLVPIDSGAAVKQKWSCRHQLKTYLHTLDPAVALDSGCVPGSPPTIF